MRVLSPLVTALIVRFLTVCLPCIAQTAPVLLGVTYSPAPSLVAPGQIARLEVAGMKPILPEGIGTGVFIRAEDLPLPRTLGNVSVAVKQQRIESHLPVSETSYDASIFSIQQGFRCQTGDPNCSATVIFVQIPVEINAFSTGDLVRTQIVISQNGAAGPVVGVDARPYVVHIIRTTCEVGTSIDCRRAVTHADGTPVTATEPARPGEVVTLYAWGMGTTSPPVPTGEATPRPLPVLGPDGKPNSVFRAAFAFGPEIGPSSPRFENSFPVEAYLVAGQCGLYQVNLKLPDNLPAGVQKCGGGYYISSNLTISVGTASSFDGIGICVAP